MSPIETPIAYVRTGDDQELTQRFRERSFDIREHSACYRSIHYVFATQPLQRRVLVEVQVRTIFEEGWSEIDHRVRYPNFSDNQLVGYFLAIFNRLAGSADEMGSFVKNLVTTLSNLQAQVADATTAKEQEWKRVEDILDEMEQLRQQDSESKAIISKLKAEMTQVRNSDLLQIVFPRLDKLDLIKMNDIADLHKLRFGLDSMRDLENKLSGDSQSAKNAAFELLGFNIGKGKQKDK